VWVIQIWVNDRTYWWKCQNDKEVLLLNDIVFKENKYLSSLIKWNGKNGRVGLEIWKQTSLGPNN